MTRHTRIVWKKDLTLLHDAFSVRVSKYIERPCYWSQEGRPQWLEI